MSRGIVILLVCIVIVGIFVLYAVEQGGTLLLKAPPHDRIAFVSDREGNTDIWTMNTDGTDVKQVTNDAADDRLPTWSHDAREIASVSDRLNGEYQLFVSSWDGSHSDCLTSSNGTKDQPSWSSDNKSITYLSSGKVYMTRRHGGDETQCLPPVGAPGAEMMGQWASPVSYACWSPDNKALLFVQDTDQGKSAYVLEITPDELGGESIPDPLGVTRARILSAAWSPSEDKVAVGFTNRNGQNGLLSVDIGEMNGVDIMNSKGDGLTASRPAWSPDGKRIAFEMWQAKGGLLDKCVGIYVVEASGGKPVPVMKGNATEPTWSPDGKMVACAVANKDGKRDIWRVNADGSGPVNLTKGKGDNHSPAWSPAPGRK